VIQRTLPAVPGAHILDIDDHSPDVSSPFADILGRSDENLQVMPRSENSGLARHR